MALLGITDVNLDHIAAYETDRLNLRAVHPVQSLSPVETAMTGKGGGKTQNPSSGSADIGKHPLKSDAKAGKGSVNPANKRGPGRPKGSKNKPKTAESELKPKRGPGRPKGSKNKPKQSAPAQVEKRKPGRPKGSKNKPKT